MVIIPAGATVYLDLTTEKGQESLQLVNTLERIIPVAESSKLIVTVGNNDVKTFGVPFSAAVSWLQCEFSAVHCTGSHQEYCV